MRQVRRRSKSKRQESVSEHCSQVPKHPGDDFQRNSDGTDFRNKQVFNISLTTLQLCLELFMMGISLSVPIWRLRSTAIVILMTIFTLLRHVSFYQDFVNHEIPPMKELCKRKDQLFNEFHANLAIFCFSWIFSMQTRSSEVYLYYTLMVLSGIVFIPLTLQFQYMPNTKDYEYYFKEKAGKLPARTPSPVCYGPREIRDFSNTLDVPEMATISVEN
uniref:Uncharacterized protein n=1 Tax=Panagrolaimus sp. JU765 TaxID=591449 RepID=A0AC34Q1K4_9BILA